VHPGLKNGTTAFSILLFTEGSMSSGFFPKKKPPCRIYQWQHVNRKCSKQAAKKLHSEGKKRQGTTFSLP
jgi:hypothetical protein